VVTKNPSYYEANLVRLDQVVFLPIGNIPMVNLYKAGGVDATDAGWFPSSLFARGLGNKKDLHSLAVLDSFYFAINTKKTPFDNVLLRYALNMATNKKAITKALDSGDTQAIGYVPPMEGYEAPARLPVKIDEKVYDVVSYSPPDARELLAKSGFPGGMDSDGSRLTVDLVNSGSTEVFQVLQQQWSGNLHIDVKLTQQEFKVYIQTLLDVSYNGLAYSEWTGKYKDPNTFLDLFLTNSIQSGTGWSDPKYDAMLAEANSTLDRHARMKKLAECEKYLLTAMPQLPICHRTWHYLQKPYVRGMESNALDEHYFKYAWIDTQWKPDAQREQMSQK
jgi:ABC-type oligopeptide transport system substrate-binding subunit